MGSVAGSVKGPALPLGHGGMASGAMTPRSSPRSYVQAGGIATPADKHQASQSEVETELLFVGI